MDITQISRLEEQGAILDLRPGGLFSLHDPDKIWLVLGGELDLFLVEMSNGEPTGARHHFLRAEVGDPVIGFDNPSNAIWVLSPIRASAPRFCAWNGNSYSIWPAPRPRRSIP